VLVSLDTLTERDTKADRRGFTRWLFQLRKTADAAGRESIGTTKYVSGKHTQQLRDMVQDVCRGKMRFPPPGEVVSRTPPRKRLSPKKQEFGFLHREGSRYPSLFERIQAIGSWGPDYTIPMGIHGVGVSPAASTTPEGSRYNIQHTPMGIRKGRRRKKGMLGTLRLPPGTGPSRW
jgi:hypothetical protein